MIVGLALATNTHPGPWWDEPDEAIYTALELLEEQAAAVNKRKGGRRGR